jgi:hypothetical protein
VSCFGAWSAQGTLYEYVEGKTADEETKRKWFHQHFGHVQPKSRLAEEVTTGSSSEGASSPPSQQQSFVDLDAGTPPTLTTP